MRIILASQSPFRKYALDLLGLEYEVIPSDIDEKLIRDENPRIMVKNLSEAKAFSVAEKHKDAIIIASDAIVYVAGNIYEKPCDKEEAFEMLSNLSDSEFEFITGLTVFNSHNGKTLSTVQSCQVKFRALLDYEIKDYIAKYPVLKCAGAFEFDGLLRFAEYVNGNYNFRTGLPVNELILFLRKQGVRV